MSRMFFAYDNDIDLDMQNIKPHADEFNNNTEATKMIYSKTGKFLGVQAKHGLPLSLYFNLSDGCGNIEFIELIANSNIRFKINSTTHKNIIEKEFNGFEIFNPLTNDLCINLLPQDMESLKQESYHIELQLLHDNDCFSLFNKQDIYLVIR